MRLFADGKRRAVALPDLGIPVADTHCHLTMLDEPAYALARSAFAGVDLIVTVLDPVDLPGSTPKAFFRWLSAVQDEAAQYVAELKESGWELPERPAGSPRAPQNMRVTAGCHPHNASKFDEAAHKALNVLLAHPQVSVLGEIGLDYFYDYSPRDVQRDVFIEQLLLAQELGMPATLHIRDAHQDAAGILQDIGVPEAGCVLHCFGQDEVTLAPFLELGCHVSYAGPVTFKKSDELRRTVASTPLDRILVETDAPFMSPEPLRGIQSEPGFIRFTAQRIADVRAEALGESVEDTLRALWNNSVRIYDPEVSGNPRSSTPRS